MDFTAFKKIVHSTAQQIAAKVVELHKPDVTPNFYAAEIALPHAGTVYLLCSIGGHWAFSSRYKSDECSLDFVDCPSLADVLEGTFGITPMLKADLLGDFRKQPFNSEADVRYWKPKTLGEGVFNWWD